MIGSRFATVIIRPGKVPEHYLSYTLETAQALALCVRGETAYIYESGNPLPIETHEGVTMEAHHAD